MNTSLISSAASPEPMHTRSLPSASCSRTYTLILPCDNFLYGFKVAAYGRAGHSAMRPKWQKSRGGMPENARVAWADVGQHRGREDLWPGKAGHRGGLATPAASCAAAHRRGLPAARSATPGQARTGNPPQRPRELASARTASGHEH